MKEREFYKTTPLGKEKSDTIKKSILIEYPDEDLFEDGELSNDLKYDKRFLISEVEKKIVWLWRNNKIVIAFRDGGNSNYGTAIVGTVDPSDNSITFGS